MIKLTVPIILPYEVLFKPLKCGSRPPVAADEVGIRQPGVSLQEIPEGDADDVRIAPEYRELASHLRQLPRPALPVKIVFTYVNGNARALNNPQATTDGLGRSVLQTMRLAADTINQAGRLEPSNQSGVDAGIAR